jgi:hypothetical protein
MQADEWDDGGVAPNGVSYAAVACRVTDWAARTCPLVALVIRGAPGVEGRFLRGHRQGVLLARRS